MHITPYSHGDLRVIDPLRVRKLLLKRKEIDYLFGKVKERGLSVIPLKLYFKGRGSSSRWGWAAEEALR